MIDPSPFGRSERLWRQWKHGSDSSAGLPKAWPTCQPARSTNTKTPQMVPCGRRRTIHASPAVQATPDLAKRTEITKQTELNVINCSECKHGDGASRSELFHKAKQNRSPAGAASSFSGRCLGPARRLARSPFSDWTAAEESARGAASCSSSQPRALNLTIIRRHRIQVRVRKHNSRSPENS